MSYATLSRRRTATLSCAVIIVLVGVGLVLAGCTPADEGTVIDHVYKDPYTTTACSSADPHGKVTPCEVTKHAEEFCLELRNNQEQKGEVCFLSKEIWDKYPVGSTYKPTP